MNTADESKCGDSLPRKGDVLFRGISHVSDGGLVDWGFTEGSARFGPCGRWSIIAEGNFLAANSIVETALTNGGADALVFAAVLLYRRYLEMKLKAALGQIHDTGVTEQHWKPDDKPPNHKLTALWNSLRIALGDLGSDLSPESIDTMEQLVSEMHEYDPDGQSFGYGEDAKERKRLDGVHSIDLQNLRAVMGRVDRFFTALQEEIQQEQDYQTDLSQESGR